jgi:Domain of unknown function (DUF397)
VNSDELGLATARWFKSSFSNGQNNCVEVARLGDGHVGLRDSKDNGTGPVHVFTQGAWQAFIAGAKDGQFDRT